MECLLILAELQGIIFLVFRKLLRAAGKRRSSLLPDRLSGQLQSFSVGEDVDGMESEIAS